jgi:parallel beta-helix repeat protein
MKTKLIFAALFIGAIFSTSCQKESVDSSVKSNLKPTSQNKSVKAKIATFDVNNYNKLVAVNNTRLARLEGQLKRGAMQSITVPTDFATIQEAVDAASEGANIFVNSGTYTEDVVISTAGLKLQARDNVLLNGSFILAEGADNVTIKKFNIDATNSAFITGIFGVNANGCQVVQNTITAIPANFTVDQGGIYFMSCDGVTVSNNTVTGADWAIVFVSSSEYGNGTCNNNMITNNTMSANYVVGIQIQGNCQHNTVSNNTVSEGTDSYITNGGIYLYGIPDYIGLPEVLQGECNNNIVKNNNCTEGSAGIAILFNAYNNTIGPNNTTNKNYYYGIFLYSGASNNHIFNNTALNNVVCDIVVQDDGVPCLNNTFSNNNYVCFSQY